VSNTGSWIAKSLAISSVIGLLTWAGFYLFFRVHQELDIQPAYAFKLGVIAFVLSAIVAMIYFRNRAGAR
jgi:multidrug transporter EmrE-like cation transporter